MRAWDARGSAIDRDADDRVVWISGRSSAAHAALTPGQRGLIAQAEPHGFEPVDAGFPFRAAEAPWTPTGLVEASARNAVQYAALRLRPGAARQAAARLEPLLTRTHRRLLVVCASLGLELFLRGLRQVRPPGCRVRVVALGPVCAVRAPGGLDVRVAQAAGDVISRIGYTGPVRARPRCGHLGYVSDPEVADLVRSAARDPW